MFIYRPINYDEIPSIHNTGNAYLAINSDYYPFIDEQLAIQFNNTIINREQLDRSYAPIIAPDRGNSHIESISIDSLSNKLLSKFNDRNRQIATSKKQKLKPSLYSLI